MAASIAHRMTVAELSRLPEDNGPLYHELRQGELVPVTRPKAKHARIQKRLERLLEHLAGEQGVAVMELAFRPIPEYELRVADVAYLSNERWDGIDPEDHLLGAPDIVVEVLSPSNSASEIHEKEKLCLENGAQEFWVVDPERRQVKVFTPGGRTSTWQSGQEIPLPLFGSAGIPVDTIFD